MNKHVIQYLKNDPPYTLYKSWYSYNERRIKTDPLMDVYGAHDNKGTCEWLIEKMENQAAFSCKRAW